MSQLSSIADSQAHSGPIGAAMDAEMLLALRPAGADAVFELPNLGGDNGLHAISNLGPDVFAPETLPLCPFGSLIVEGIGASGPTGGSSAIFDVVDIDGTNGFRAVGDDGGALAVSPAGDVNGDGLDDFLLGMPGASRHGHESVGVVSVVFGQEAGFPADFDLSRLDGDDGFNLLGIAGGDWTGGAVASAGDFNGDGIDDLIVGASFADHDAGTAYVVFGKLDGFDANLNLSDLDGANGFRLDASKRAEAGTSVSSLGDVNGDGLDDLIVGAPESTIGSHFSAGSAFVVFGTTDEFGTEFDLAALNGANGFRIDGADSVSLLGKAVSAGDVNGDGLNDIMIGASGPGADDAYVVFGRTTGFAASMNVEELNGSLGFAVHGVHDSGAGHALSSGDFNGDGLSDLLIGAPDGPDGYAYVVFGRSQGFPSEIDVAKLNGVNGFLIEGKNGDRLGWSLSSAGDVNGDGFDDIIVGAPAPFGLSDGRAYVIYGKARGFDKVLDATKLDGSNGFIIQGDGDSLGIAVSTAGDINGDGLSDLVTNAGNGNTAYVIYGQAPTGSVHRLGTAASQTLVGGEQKDSLSGVGGDDVLWGHGGKDKLTGGTGNDTLVGGAGKDVLVGSAGADVFQYRDIGDSTPKSHDLIKVIDASDAIDLSLLDADAGTSGDQAFHLVSSFTHHAGELTIGFDGKQTLVEGDVNGDGKADLVIAISGDHHDFTNFVL